MRRRPEEVADVRRTARKNIGLELSVVQDRWGSDMFGVLHVEED